MKKKLLFLPLVGLLLSACSFEDLMFWKKKEDSTPQNQEGSSDDDGGEGEGDGSSTNHVTKTINFFGSYLPNDWKSSGVSMDSTLLSCSTQNEKLINATKTQVNDSNLLSDLFFKKLNTAVYDSSGLIIQIGTGNPAKSNFSSGVFTWTSSKKITKVEVTAQCYAKDQGAVDSKASLKIEAGGKGTDVDENNNYQRPITNAVSADMSFEVESGESPAYKTYSYEYNEGINRFCLTSLGGRVFLKSLVITWVS